MEALRRGASVAEQARMLMLRRRRAPARRQGKEPVPAPAATKVGEAGGGG